MKKLILLVPIWLLSLSTFAQSNGLYVEKSSCTSAVDYNDYLVDLIDMIDNSWTKAIEEEDLKKAMVNSKTLNTISAAVLKSLAKLEAWDGESAFKQATINYAKHMNSISKKELPKFIKLIRAKGEMTTQREKQAEDLIPILDGKREALFTTIENAQTGFSIKYNFTIEGK